MTENTETKTKEQVEGLFEAGAQYAFSRARRHPSAQRFLFGQKNRTELFDLEQTVSALEKAKAFVTTLAQSGKQILFISSKPIARDAIRSASERINQPFVAGRFIGGTLTNFAQIQKRVARLEKLTHDKEVGELSKYTKRERLLIDRDIEKLEDRFGGLAGMKSLPGALFVIDAREEEIAVREAQALGIPVVSLSGSDCNMDIITYAIPGNDVARASIKYVTEAIADAYSEGKKSE